MGLHLRERNKQWPQACTGLGDDNKWVWVEDEYDEEGIHSVVKVHKVGYSCVWVEQQVVGMTEVEAPSSVVLLDEYLYATPVHSA